jgi:hypothetical protein
LTEEFFQKESSEMYQFNDMHQALPEIHPLLVHPIAPPTAWAAEFDQESHAPILLPHEQAEFEQAFQTAAFQSSGILNSQLTFRKTRLE